MKIIRYKNKYMMKNSKDPNNYHYYAVFWNRKSKKYNAIRLTHIAVKDISNYNKANKGTILPIRLKKIDKYADSGITNINYVNNAKHKNIEITRGDVIYPNISSKVSNRILYFLKKKNIQNVNVGSLRKKKKKKKVK